MARTTSAYQPIPKRHRSAPATSGRKPGRPVRCRVTVTAAVTRITSSMTSAGKSGRPSARKVSCTAQVVAIAGTTKLSRGCRVTRAAAGSAAGRVSIVRV
jgi:hypothetical protein